MLIFSRYCIIKKMSFRICVFGSGSTGNCTFVSTPSTTILVDIGLAVTRVERCLKTLAVSPDNVSVLITHAHHDHTSGIANFCRRHPSTRVYCHESCYPSVLAKLPSEVKIQSVEGDFFVGEVTVSPFKVSHDVPCVGYSLLYGGKKITVATDIGRATGAVINRLSDSDLVVLESNHDEDLVRRNPHYSEFLKARILSDGGHLSNLACADCVACLAGRGVKQVVLAHLSRENNYPELAFETCKQRLTELGIREGDDIRLEVALPDRMSSLFEIL